MTLLITLQYRPTCHKKPAEAGSDARLDYYTVTGVYSIPVVARPTKPIVVSNAANSLAATRTSAWLKLLVVIQAVNAVTSARGAVVP